MTSSVESVRSALEMDHPLDKVESHLHPEGSLDPDFFEIPSGREEIWRFTPLKRLLGIHADAPLDGDNCKVSVTAAEGVTVKQISADDSSRGSSGYVPRDRVSARAWSATKLGHLVEIPIEAEPTGVTLVGIHGESLSTASAGHLVIKAGRFSKAVVVVRFTGSAVLADNVEIIVEDGAQLTVVSVQDWADDAVHHSGQFARVGRDATLKHVAVSFGGDLIRHDFTAQYAGPGGSVEALGLYFADAGQHIEHRLFVDHAAPRTRSHVLYKGALQGDRAHTVWIGNVLIRKIAEGIETYEENRNLVLTDGAQADSVPNLEIETGEIEGAGHASATGRFDDQQLFYLRSRGIDEQEARRLVVHGFFHDLLRRIGVADLEEELAQIVEAELARTVTAEVNA
ncbi:MAG TPA: Fe-S cluster assembly protein SufD [Marmoricola sp.]|nr:Fe-S cluster assembly protein SufD [Nocardioidaceae bacterium]HRV67881.1 Fe-S cluster assembly protein SufD [Marmoricola sp.]